MTEHRIVVEGTIGWMRSDEANPGSHVFCYFLELDPEYEKGRNWGRYGGMTSEPIRGWQECVMDIIHDAPEGARVRITAEVI